MAEPGWWVDWKEEGKVPADDGKYLLRIATPIGDFVRPAVWNGERQVWRDPDDQSDFLAVDPRLRILAWFEPLKSS